MKFDHLCKFAAVLTLPFALISCGEKKEDDGASKDTKSEEKAARSHTEIGREVNVVMSSLMTSMSSITDVESAKAFGEDVKKHCASLQGLLDEAKALDPPTEEELAAIKKLKEENDAQGEALMGKMMETMSTNPQAEEIGKIMGTVMQNEEMDAATDGLKELYKLED